MARKQLRRHVGRSTRRALVGLLTGETGESEVGDPRAAAAVDHHVGRLQIAVQDAALVGSGQPGTQLPRNLDRLLQRRSPEPAQDGAQVLAVDVLHRQEELAVGLADVVHATDVGVRDLPRHANLVAQACQRRRIVGEMGGQELQRDRLAELQVVGAVDLAHAAPAEQPDDAVALAESRSR